MLYYIPARTVYNMCTQRTPNNWSEQLYRRYGDPGGLGEWRGKWARFETQQGSITKWFILI